MYLVNDLPYFRAHREAVVKAVAALGCEVFVMAGRCTAQDARETDTFSLIPQNVVRQKFDPLADFRLALAVRKWVKANKPDLVHMIGIKTALFGTLGLVLPFAMKGFQLVWTMPGMGKIYEPGIGFAHRLRRLLTTRGLALAAKRGVATITVENAGDKRRVVNEGITTDDRIEVIDGSGLDLDHFSPPAETKQGLLTFLMATRLLKAKGVGTYINAARRLREEGFDERFLLAGLTDPINPDAYDETIIRKASDEGVIEWLGAVEQSGMPDLLRDADVFCLPTRLQEGLPRALLEAAACGCALVAPDQVPIRRILVDGKNGWLIHQTEEDDVVDAFKEAIGDPDQARVMGKYAASHIRSLPVSDADVCQRFLGVYKFQETAE